MGSAHILLNFFNGNSYFVPLAVLHKVQTQILSLTGQFVEDVLWSKIGEDPLKKKLIKLPTIKIDFTDLPAQDSPEEFLEKLRVHIRAASEKNQ